jgi:hypothetical protein
MQRNPRQCDGKLLLEVSSIVQPKGYYLQYMFNNKIYGPIATKKKRRGQHFERADVRISCKRIHNMPRREIIDIFMKFPHSTIGADRHEEKKTRSAFYPS